MVIGVIQLSNRSRQALVCAHYTTVKGCCPAPTRSGGPATPFIGRHSSYVYAHYTTVRNQSDRWIYATRCIKNVIRRRELARCQPLSPSVRGELTEKMAVDL